MENMEWDFLDISDNVKEKIRLWESSMESFMESFGNLILGGVGVFAFQRDNIFPVYLSSGVGGMFYNRKELCVKARECIENHTTLDCTMPYPLTAKSERWVWIRGREVMASGECHIFIALIQDVTKQKQLENELAVQNERYRLLEETSNEILFELDLAKDVMSYSFKEMDGSLIRKRIAHYRKSLETNPMIHPDYIDLFLNHLSMASQKKTTGQMEYLSKISGHGFEWHHMYYTSLENGNGMINRIVGRIRNIHDEVLNRQQSEAPLSVLMKSYTGIQSRIIELIDNAELEDNHALVLLTINHCKKIAEQNGVACVDVIIHHMLDVLQEKVGRQAVYGQMEDGRILIYFKNISEQELDEKMCEIIADIQEADYQIKDLHPTCSAGAARMCGAVDFITFYHEVEEALHIAKLTKGERYIRV